MKNEFLYFYLHIFCISFDRLGGSDRRKNSDRRPGHVKRHLGDYVVGGLTAVGGVIAGHKVKQWCFQQLVGFLCHMLWQFIYFMPFMFNCLSWIFFVYIQNSWIRFCYILFHRLPRKVTVHLGLVSEKSLKVLRKTLEKPL